MRYRVRTRDGGELDYASFGQVEQAWLLGLIDPDDEVLEEGKSRWRKASSIPLLVSARRSSEQVWQGTWFGWVLLWIAGATVAIVLISQKRLDYVMAGAVLAFAIASLMIRVTVKAWERRKPH